MIANSHPRIKNPFGMNRVYLNPATPNPSISNNGIEYRIDSGVKLKFVQGILTTEKIPIAARQMDNVTKNLIMHDLNVGSSRLRNRLYFLFSHTTPKEEKNNA